MPIDNMQPLRGLNRMTLSGLSSREREQWYNQNRHLLDKYSIGERKRAAEQIYKNQQYVKMFGQDEFNKTAGMPGGAKFRNNQLKHALINDAWDNTFRAKHYFIKDATGTPYMKNNKPMVQERDDKDVNVSDEWLNKYSLIDDYGKEQILRAYGNGEFKTDIENSKDEGLWTKLSKIGSMSFNLALKQTINNITGKDEPLTAEDAFNGPGIEPISSTPIGEINLMIERGKGEYKKAKDTGFLDKIYDESLHRMENSETVSKLKSEAYLDDRIVGRDDEETKKIFYSIITPTDPDSNTDYDKANLGIPTYAAYFDGGNNVQKEVKDITVDQMRQIIATKYAMEKAGIPKLAVRDMLERQAQKHVYDNEGWWRESKKFIKDVAIAASSYTADKWNGIKNVGYMIDDAYDGGVDVWVDENGNPVGEKDHPEVLDNIQMLQDANGGSYLVSSYKGKDGKQHEVHKEKLSRSALLMMGHESTGVNAGGELDTWTNPAMWTKKEQYGVWTDEEAKKWDKIGASPDAVAWDPDDTSHIMYDSFKMMSFGLADQALMFVPNGAGALSKFITGTGKAASISRGIFNTIGKLGSSTKTGQALNNAAASLGIGFAYARSNAYEQFAKNLSDIEEAVKQKSTLDVKAKYDTDPEYKAYIDERIAEVTEANIQKTLNENAQDIENGNVVINEDLLRQQSAYAAYLQVQEEEVNKQIDVNKKDPSFYELQENAINTVAHASNIMAVTDAMKYFAVGAFGYRRYLYENRAGLFGQTGKPLKDAFRSTRNALKHIKEARNAEGKLRLTTEVGKDFTELKKSAKQFGKVVGSQFVGGAWTNGTDDMQVDGVQQINEDAMQQVYDSYLAGEPLADTYGTLDQVSSFMTGMGRSLGQKTTWDVTLIGGLGSAISVNLNLANLVSLATPAGRQAFREQYNTRYKRDAEGAIKYKKEPVLDEEGNTVKDVNGEVVYRQVPEKENVRWHQNFWERANFFVQNGVLNTYYGNKQDALSKVDRVQAANFVLDEVGDFTDLEDYITANAVGENVTSEREKLTSQYLRAVRLARSLRQVGRTAEGKMDTGDPLLASTLYQNAINLINKANSMEVYDTGVNVGDFTAEEVENVLKEWYSKNPQEVRSEANDVKALRSIAENAKELVGAMDAYDEASEHVAKSEAKSGKKFSSHVKNKMIEDYVLYNHWKNRYNTLQKETEDTSSMSRQLSPEEFVASVGGMHNTQQLVRMYDMMIEETTNEEKEKIDKKVEDSNKKLEKARKKYNEAKTTDEKETAQKELNKVYAEHDSNLAKQEVLNGLISMLSEKRDKAAEALNQAELNYASELSDVQGYSDLSTKEQSEAVRRARNIPWVQSQIEEQQSRRKSVNQQSTPKINKEIKRLQQQEKSDKTWLKEKLNMNDAQLQQFIEKVAQRDVRSSADIILTADQIMSLDPVTRSKMLDPENRRLYSEKQLKEIDDLVGRLNMKDPSIIQKLHDLARLGQQMDKVMDSYKRLSQHPEGAALDIEADKITAASAAERVLDRRFAEAIAKFINEYDENVIVNSSDEYNDLVSAIEKYNDRIINLAALWRFYNAKAKAYDLAIAQGNKPEITQREKDNAVFELLRTLNTRILDVLDKEQLIENHRTELDKARRWVAVIEDISGILQTSIIDNTKRQRLSEHIFNLVFFCQDKEDVMRQLEIEANNPTNQEFVADILNLLDDLQELGHLRNTVVYERNAEKYKDLFAQKKEIVKNKNIETINKAFSIESNDNIEDFGKNLNEVSRKALESILNNSKNRKLNELGTRYIIDGKPYARVTAIKILLNGAKIKPFDETSPWGLPSTLIGNSLDEFGRDVFNGIYDNMSKEERLNAFKERYSNSTAENYEKVYQKLKDFQRKLKENNQRIIKLGTSLEDQGTAVAAGTVTVVMPDGTEKEIRVAGSLDVLAMDNQGNLHIYDFKTHRSSSFTITDATSKGYDRQLSMYARLLEREYGVRVASINIIPVRAKYLTPVGVNSYGKKTAEYRRTDSNSNQLQIKEKGNSQFEEFRGASFEVENVIPLVRLQENNMIIDYGQLNKENKKMVDALLAEQDENQIQHTEPNNAEPQGKPVENKQDEVQRKSLSVTEINNTVMLGNNRVAQGHYIVETDDEGSVRIIFDKGDTKARRSTSLNEAGVTKREAFGSKDVKISLDQKLPILNVVIDADGNTTVTTFEGPVFGDAAKKMLNAAFPEMRDYMEQFPKPVEVEQQKADKDFSNPDDHFLMFVTYNGWDRKGDLKNWSRSSTPDIRTWPDGWGKHNDVFYYKKSISGRDGDNITIWFKESPTDAQKKQIEQLLDSGENNSDVVKKQILNILSGKQEAPANEHILDDATINDFTNIAGHINAQIQNIPDSTRGKKQLNRGVSDLQEALKTKDAIKIANALEKFVNNTHRMDQTDQTKGVQDLVNYILDKLKVAGYEVNYRIGERYNASDKVIATFSEDESLPVGDQIIDSAIKPAITRNGVQIQKATVNVRQNMPYEFEAADAIEHHVRKIPKDHRAKTALTNRAKELTQAIRDKKDPVTILNILNRIMIAASKMTKEGATKVFADPILKNANEIYEIFQREGYEIVDVIGQEYNDGMPFEAQFIPDDSLEPGQRIITGVSQPQIDKDGVMVQAPKVTVRQNLEKDLARNTGEPEALSQRILIRSSAERNGEETGDRVAFGEKGSDLHMKSLDPRTIARANDKDKHKVGNDVYLVENPNGTTTIARGPVGGRGGAYGVVIWRKLTSVEKDKIVSLLEKDIPTVDNDAAFAQKIDDILHGKSRTLLAAPSYASPRSWESSQRGAAERMYHGAKILTGEWLQTDLMLFKLAQDAGIIKNISLIEINPDNHALAITESDWEEAVEQLQKLGINSPRELAEINPDTFDRKARRKAVVQAEKQLKEQPGEDVEQEVQEKESPQTMDDAAIRDELSNLKNKEDADSAERAAALKKEQQRRKEIQDKYSVGTQVKSNLLGTGVVVSHQEENGLGQMTVKYDETGERMYYFLENELPIPTGVKVDLVEEEDNINLHDNGTDVWVETPEGNSQEAHDSSNFDESINENGTLEDNNSNPSDNSPAVNQQSNQDADSQDTRILPLSGNSLPVYWNTETSPLAIKGTLVTQVERREQEARAKNRHINENDTIHTFNALLDSLGIKLDDIITEELAPIFMERPDTPIKFMAVNYVTENSPGDARLNDVCFLVIDYDDNVRRIHSDGKNGRKDNGGIITAQNKQYLIIGTMGYGDYKTVDGQRKRTLWNAMFGRDPKIGTGFFKLATGKFFQNPENNGERFYVIKNNDGEFYSTELKKGSITPGWFVKLPNGQKQPLGKLINSNDREINPFRLRWDTIGFGIAEYTQFWSTMDNRAVMEVSDKEKNAGNTYVLIPAGNGKYAPAAIRPTRYAEKRDSSSGEDEIIPNSPLDQRISKLLDKLTARTYKERVQAIKELYKYLYLSNGGGINETNFWLNKKENIIRVVKSGKVVKEFSLDAPNFDRQEFKDYVKQEMRPRINITPATLTDIDLLKEYDESGALLVDIAKLRTAGSNFEIWPIGADNKVLKPEKPISLHPEESIRIKSTQIPYMGQYYMKDTNDVYWDQSGVEVIDDGVIEDLEINKRINDSRLQPEKLTSNKATYILDQSIDNPLVVDIDRSTYKVTKYKTEDAIKFIQEVIEKRKQEERDKAAQDALNEAPQDSTDALNPPKSEAPAQSREQELKEFEESSYQATLDSAKDLSNEDIQFLINKDIEMLDDNQVTVLDEESKAILNGELRAYYSELERRKQYQDKKSSEIKSINHTGINETQGSVGTMTFLELISDKNNLGRFMQALKTFGKLSKAPKEKPALMEYLRSNGINVDSIDNTKEGIDAWFETIRCRFGV